MTAPDWGIERSYRDAFGERRSVPEAVRRRLREAMGVDESTASEARPPVAVVHPGEPLPATGEVTLEDGTALGRLDALPADVPFGYHRLELDDRSVRLITGPGRCHVADGLRAWGWAVQLYATRSTASWGIGDLGDLRALADWSRSLGAGHVVVNPLGAAAPVVPLQPSPYFPSTRRFRSPLYLRIEEVPGAEAIGDRLDRLAAAGRALNGAARIDRDAIFVLKMDALDAIWAARPPRDELDPFRAGQGEPLRQWATYAAIAEREGAAWSVWPAALRDPAGAAVARFADEHADRIAFHEWVQWLLDRQLARAAHELRLIQDVPIGVDRDGADAWVWQDTLALDASMGAPPDVFNQAGQDWGLPPFVPHRLRAAGYEPFIQTLRASFRHGGGLRIDHVIGLFRLWWIPLGEDPRDGGYVRYPTDELLEIVALESARAGAVVVGEDLGTVEPGVRDELARRRVLSYKLVYFEPAPPDSYPELSLAAVTTHDLPTIAGSWLGSDLDLQRRAGLEPDHKGLATLRRRLRRVSGLRAGADRDDVVLRVHAALAGSPSALVAATLEDALLVAERPNLPGTVDEHPNWSIPLPRPLEEIAEDPFVARLAAALRR